MWREGGIRGGRGRKGSWRGETGTRKMRKGGRGEGEEEVRGVVLRRSRRERGAWWGTYRPNS